MKLFSSDRNTRLLSIYYIFNFLAISVSSSGVITDMFLLNTGIDTARLGTLKSNIYLLPALFFLLASGLLARLNKDRSICAWCYIIRCAVPALMTVTMLLCSPTPEVVYYMVAQMFIISYTCAMFANNILTRILQQVLPPGDFSRGCVFIPAQAGIIASIVSFGQIWLLEFANEDRVSFLTTLFILQFIFALLEIPAYRALMALRLNGEAKRQNVVKIFDFSGIKKISAVKELRFTFICMLLRGLYGGMLGAYLAIYLMKYRGWRAIDLALIQSALAIVIVLTSGFTGRFANKFGIMAFLGISGLICAAVNFLWGAGINSFVWMQWLFLILIYDGNAGGVLSSGQAALESGATTLYAPEGRHELSIGIGALMRAAGAFSGSCAASWLFMLLSGNGKEKFEKLFIICSLIPFVLFIIYYLTFRISKRGVFGIK